MNNWVCEHLGSSLDEIKEFGEAYYFERYFVKEESFKIFQSMNNYWVTRDFDRQYNFFQHVKCYGDKDYTWFYTVLKGTELKIESQTVHKLILLSSPVVGMDSMISRVTKTLEQDQYICNNYKRFAGLTRREKQTIVELAYGKPSHEIADLLGISTYTVATHRKNISSKIACNSFAELLKFAIAFDLV